MLPLRLALIAGGLAVFSTSQAQLINHGPWVGAVTPETADVRMVLNEPRLTTIEVSTMEDFSWPLRFAQLARQPEHPANLAQFLIRDLKPSTQYFYRIQAGRVREYQSIGRFTTPPAALRPASFKFAFGSGATTGSEAGAFAEIRYQKPLFFLHLGNAHNTADLPNELDAWHRVYDEMFDSFTQSELFRYVPFVYTWNQFDAKGAAAHKAYRHYVPHHALPADDPSTEAENAEELNPISQSFTIGRVKFIVLDTSTARTSFDGENPTMLGDWQWGWLKSEIRAASISHPLIFLVSAVPWHAEKAISDNDQHWGYFPAEKEKLTSWLKEEGIRGVHVISGNGGVLAAAIRPDEPGELSEIQSGIIDLRRGPAIGPWTDGPLLPNPGEEFFGLVEIDDQRSFIDVTFRGMNQHGHDRFKSTFRVAAPRQ
ncbi:MAG: hypothetical protein SynsKO_25740 [Synoicihabitans sp.]